MFKSLLDKCGIHLYSVTFTLYYFQNYVGMIIVTVYAENGGRAVRKAYRKFSRISATFTGDWQTHVEQI